MKRRKNKTKTKRKKKKWEPPLCLLWRSKSRCWPTVADSSVCASTTHRLPRWKLEREKERGESLIAEWTNECCCTLHLLLVLIHRLGRMGTRERRRRRRRRRKMAVHKELSIQYSTVQCVHKHKHKQKPHVKVFEGLVKMMRTRWRWASDDATYLPSFLLLLLLLLPLLRGAT